MSGVNNNNNKKKPQATFKLNILLESFPSIALYLIFINNFEGHKKEAYICPIGFI